MRIGAVIPAAGSGKRYGGTQKKQCLSLAGKPVFIRSLEPFVCNAAIEEIILVVHQEDLDDMADILSEHGFAERVRIIGGGRERFDSVHKGLKALSRGMTHVLIHDGARPLMSQELLRRCIDGLKTFQGFTAAVPSRDTIKRVAGDLVTETLNRAELMLIQTPQGFDLQTLLACYEKIDFEQTPVTDDASLFEHFHIPVHILPGEEGNIKVTYPIDLIMGEAILSERGEER